ALGAAAGRGRGRRWLAAEGAERRAPGGGAGSRACRPARRRAAARGVGVEPLVATLPGRRATAGTGPAGSRRAHVDRAQTLHVVARLELHLLAFAQRVEGAVDYRRAVEEALAASVVDEEAEAAVA